MDKCDMHVVSLSVLLDMLGKKLKVLGVIECRYNSTKHKSTCMSLWPVLFDLSRATRLRIAQENIMHYYFRKQLVLAIIRFVH
jgi:hypothetical protein